MKNNRWISVPLPVLVIAGSVIAAPDRPVQFLVPINIGAQPASPYAAAVATRAVNLDLTALTAALPESVIDLEMEPGIVYSGIVDTVEQRNETRFSLRGRLADDPDGYFSWSFKTMWPSE